MLQRYDALMDGALGQIDVHVGTSLDSYVDHPQYQLIKPHGSVNWFHPVSGLAENHHPYSLYIIQGICFSRACTRSIRGMRKMRVSSELLILDRRALRSHQI